MEQGTLDLRTQDRMEWIRDKLQAGYCICELSEDDCEQLRGTYGELLHLIHDPRDDTYDATLLGVHSPHDWAERASEHTGEGD